MLKGDLSEAVAQLPIEEQRKVMAALEKYLPVIQRLKPAEFFGLYLAVKQATDEKIAAAERL